MDGLGMTESWSAFAEITVDAIRKSIPVSKTKMTQASITPLCQKNVRMSSEWSIGNGRGINTAKM